MLQERLEGHLLSTQAAPKLEPIAAELRTSCEEGRALIPRMRWLLNQDQHQLERIKVSLETKITDLEHRLAELKHHISQQKEVLSDLLIAQTDLFSQALYSESAKAAEELRFPDRANRQERKDCVEEFFQTVCGSNAEIWQNLRRRNGKSSDCSWGRYSDVKQPASFGISPMSFWTNQKRWS